MFGTLHVDFGWYRYWQCSWRFICDVDLVNDEAIWYWWWSACVLMGKAMEHFHRPNNKRWQVQTTLVEYSLLWPRFEHHGMPAAWSAKFEDNNSLASFRNTVINCSWSRLVHTPCRSSEMKGLDSEIIDVWCGAAWHLQWFGEIR